MNTRRYASETTVTVSRSRDEIEKVLKQHGATAFAYFSDEQWAVVEFQAHGRRIRFVLAAPDATDPEFTRTPTGQVRVAAAAQRAHEQAVRQRWRALLLLVKAKLESVASGIQSFETEFLPYVVLPSGRTVAEDVGPLIDHAYNTGQVAPLQIGPGS